MMKKSIELKKLDQVALLAVAGGYSYSYGYSYSGGHGGGHGSGSGNGSGNGFNNGSASATGLVNIGSGNRS